MNVNLLKVLRTSSLEGVALRNMQVLVSGQKVSVFLAHGTRLTTWYLTLLDGSIQVDAVKALEGRVESGTASALLAIFANPLRSKEPAALIGSTCGDIYLYIPTTQMQAATQRGQFVEAQRFKSYTFKDSGSAILHVAASGGRAVCAQPPSQRQRQRQPIQPEKTSAGVQVPGLAPMTSIDTSLEHHIPPQTLNIQ